MSEIKTIDQKVNAETTVGEDWTQSDEDAYQESCRIQEEIDKKWYEYQLKLYSVYNEHTFPPYELLKRYNVPYLDRKKYDRLKDLYWGKPIPEQGNQKINENLKKLPWCYFFIAGAMRYES